MEYILHVVPDSINNTRKVFIGSTKDVMGRLEYFGARAHRVREFVCTGRSDDEAVSMLRAADLRECRAVLFEYEMYVGSLDFLKRHHPDIRRVVRAHNANLPHLVDQFRGKLRMIHEGRGGDLAQAAETVHLALSRFRLDGACADLADVIAPICRWEADHYWAELTAPEKVVNVPYFVPRTFVEQIPTRTRRNLCLFAMGTGGSMAPLLYDAGRNAVQLVNALGADVAAEWEFRITGNLKPPDVLGPLGRLKPTGLMASPLPLLAEARAVAIPSDLGMGFKTKILEAILAGCWVLVTEEVLDRQPEVIRPWCHAIDSCPERFAETLKRCAVPPTSGDPNALLRDEAFRALDRIFAPDSTAPRPVSTSPSIAVSRPQNGAESSPADQWSFRNEGDGDLSFGQGRIIYHTYLEPVLVRSKLIESSPVVFEYGVGRGQILRSVSEAGLTCGGVDASSALLDSCRKVVPRAAALGLVNESGRCDFPSEWADFAYSFEAIRHISKTSQIVTTIAEIARILRPGGYVALRFRSARGQRPRMPLLKRELLFNMEHRTLMLHLRPLRASHPVLRRVRIPRLRVHGHGERDGIPLSVGHLRRVLRQHGIEVLGIEPVRNQAKDHLFWVTGQKGR